MSDPRFGRFQKATALLPLAMLSAAVTASLAGVGPTTAVAETEPVSALPDGSSVPAEAIEAPASLSEPGVVAPGVQGRPDRAVATATTSGIPAAALAAYQRAETVINAADRSCRISWQLIAAIGRVESDHGRYGGNVLDDDGRATPGIYGIALNGRNDTQAISDTDAGQYDDDARWDRAVGPMQFIPSTWSVVGVDGDNDGTRDPQDIDDAALASAVYLCSGNDDLSTTPGQRAAVFRYNHSDDYVDLVLSFMNAYLDGDFTSVPNSTSSSAGYFSPAPEPVRPEGGRNDGPKPPATPPSSGGGGTGGGGTGGGGGGEETPTGPIEQPGGNTGGGGGGGGGGGVPNLPEPPDLPPVEDVLTQAEATTQCLAQLGVDSVASLNPLQLLDFNSCMDELGF
ncbi:lytic murein transglycosylase [Nocardioides euryhalodurans]|uniref:Transglycosylase SLT domain-containing protein n=1 Tax=Nocardioides euryhalodurans TaxID=2518370 RepID=A0A4P7GKH1_9ACTN|nr:lytic murein transglycosylase [Nocardioides euryhalodurans]QBR92525.1 hypothetical protein EXE57_09705 [Nocardioides euryhalodurans]